MSKYVIKDADNIISDAGTVVESLEGHDGTLGLTGSANRTINATFGTNSNSFMQFNLGGTGTNTFAPPSAKQYFKTLTFSGAAASKAVFAGAGVIADIPLTGESDLLGNRSSLIAESARADASLSDSSLIATAQDVIAETTELVGQAIAEDDGVDF